MLRELQRKLDPASLIVFHSVRRVSVVFGTYRKVGIPRFASKSRSQLLVGRLESDITSPKVAQR
jgi:hypothetical protein